MGQRCQFLKAPTYGKQAVGQGKTNKTHLPLRYLDESSRCGRYATSRPAVADSLASIGKPSLKRYNYKNRRKKKVHGKTQQANLNKTQAKFCTVKNSTITPLEIAIADWCNGISGTLVCISIQHRTPGTFVTRHGRPSTHKMLCALGYEVITALQRGVRERTAALLCRGLENIHTHKKNRILFPAFNAGNINTVCTLLSAMDILWGVHANWS